MKSSYLVYTGSNDKCDSPRYLKDKRLKVKVRGHHKGRALNAS